MDGTEKQITATTVADASVRLRTPADELADAQAMHAIVHRVAALGRSVQALADPDNENSATEGAGLDGRLRALEELGRAIAETADNAAEAASETLLAARCRADATEARASTSAGALSEPILLVCEILDATANLELLAQREPWVADDMVPLRDAVGGLATTIDRAARGALDAMERAQS